MLSTGIFYEKFLKEKIHLGLALVCQLLINGYVMLCYRRIN